MKQFAKRIGKLYLFWLIATAPLTIYGRFIANHSLSIGEQILNFIHTSIWSVSFAGSWYLVALLQCAFIIYFLKKYFSNSTILFISFIFYILPCVAASYDYLFSEKSLVINFISLFTSIIFRPYHCFPAGLIYVAIGMYIAEKQCSIIKKISSWQIVLFCTSSICMFVIENYYIYKYSEGLRTDSDAFFSLIPLSVSLILIAFKADETTSIKLNTKLARQISTIMYFSQFTFISILSKLQTHNLFPTSNITLYFLVIICTIALTYILLNLKNKYSFLKYAF